MICVHLDDQVAALPLTASAQLDAAKRIYRLLVLHGYYVDLEACVLIWHAWSGIDGSEWRALPAEDGLLLNILVTQAQMLTLDTEGFEV